MISPYTRHMYQVATYWEPGVNDGFGNLSFAAVQPVLLRCRWENKTVLFRSSSGQEVTSEAVVYTQTDVLLRGYLFLGDEVATGPGLDPRSLAGAREIRRVDSSPSLTADVQLYKAYL